jgi:hypothetical protein
VRSDDTVVWKHMQVSCEQVSCQWQKQRRLVLCYRILPYTKVPAFLLLIPRRTHTFHLCASLPACCTEGVKKRKSRDPNKPKRQATACK